MRKSLLVLGFVLLLPFCSSDFEPRTYLKQLEILALKQTPSEIYLSQSSSLEVTPLSYVPEGKVITEQSWSICPFSKGSRSDYDCALKSCETKETPDEEGVLKRPLATLFSSDCFTEISERTKNLSSNIETDASSLKFQPRLALVYEAKTDGGEERRAVLELPIDFASFAAPTIPVTRKIEAPKIKNIKLNGVSVFSEKNPSALQKEKEFELEIEVIPGTDSEEQTKPDVLVHFYATMGKFKEGIQAGKKVNNIWTLETYGLSQKEAELYVVVRDRNGGQDWWSLKFPIN